MILDLFSVSAAREYWKHCGRVLIWFLKNKKPNTLSITKIQEKIAAALTNPRGVLGFWDLA